MTAPRRAERAAGHGEDGDDGDALLTQAIDIVRRSDKASASLLQRRLRIGYAPADGSRFREVLVTPDGWGGDIGPDEDSG